MIKLVTLDNIQEFKGLQGIYGYLDNPTWNGVSMALKIGLRGLSGNITLSDLKNKIIENKDNGL